MLDSQLHECFLVDRHSKGFSLTAPCFLCVYLLFFREPEVSFTEAFFFVLLYSAYHSSHVDYFIMTSTMEQSTSAPSVEGLTGTTTDPTGTTNKLEKAVDQLNANMDTMSTFLGQLCQSISTGECARESVGK